MLPGADSWAGQFRAVVRAGSTPCSSLMVPWWETAACACFQTLHGTVMSLTLCAASSKSCISWWGPSFPTCKMMGYMQCPQRANLQCPRRFGGGGEDWHWLSRGEGASWDEDTWLCLHQGIRGPAGAKDCQCVQHQKGLHPTSLLLGIAGMLLLC